MLLRKLIHTNRLNNSKIEIKKNNFISFACNDYLGLSHHPELIEENNKMTIKYGVGAGSSRLVSGNNSLYRKLELKLAKMKNTEDAVVFGSGYLANIGTIPALMGQDDLIIIDELAHSCLFSGAYLSKGKVLKFNHNNIKEVKIILNKNRLNYKKCLLITEGVFSMEGDNAPLQELLELANNFDTWMMVDDAHGFGVINKGKGSSFISNKFLPIPIQMGTLSKAVGTYGGYVCSSKPVINLIKNKARSFIYTTGLPPGVIASSIKSLDIIEKDTELVQKPMQASEYFSKLLNLKKPNSAIIPIILGSEKKVLKLNEQLMENGFLVGAIRPPTIPVGTSRIRCSFTADHKMKDIEKLSEIIKSNI
ncbi:MAG: hypothetical protein CBC38_06530 [Gammaproteobacteria bacterium TMED78]|nr:MAG: hypothetical protein CBC38_06530 [Gammaproteobacteria bacterium TMED78]